MKVGPVSFPPASEGMGIVILVFAAIAVARMLPLPLGVKKYVP